MTDTLSPTRYWIILALAAAANPANAQHFNTSKGPRIPLTDPPISVALVPPETATTPAVKPATTEDPDAVAAPSQLRELPPSLSAAPLVPPTEPAEETPSIAEMPEGSPSQPSLSQLGTDEVVRQRFPNGQIQLERSVTLDGEGNYVNDGLYQEWDQAGNLIAAGEFVVGHREGKWFRIYQGNESNLFAAYPYSKMTAPFRSEAEFSAGVLNGIWKITDAEGRLVSEIASELGQRNGTATWYHPTGEVMYRATYKDGVLDGEMVEFDPAGKELRKSKFIEGQQLKTVVEKYSNGRPKFEYVLLGPPQQVKELDRWWEAQPAEYGVIGTGTKDGSFTSWYENGQLRAQGTYANDVLQGAFASWFENGQLESAGEYQAGQPTGTWNWWHDNGMKRATGEYVDGKPAGSWMNWQPDGKRILNAKPQSVLTESEPAKPVPNNPRGRYSVTRQRSTR